MLNLNIRGGELAPLSLLYLFFWLSWPEKSAVCAHFMHNVHFSRWRFPYPPCLPPSQIARPTSIFRDKILLNIYSLFYEILCLNMLKDFVYSSDSIKVFDDLAKIVTSEIISFLNYILEQINSTRSIVH